MKRTFYFSLFLAAAAFLQSCSTGKSAFKDVPDDIYYTSADDKYYKAETTEEGPKAGTSPDEKSDYGNRQNPDSESEYRKDSKILGEKDGSTYINNNYYYDDYNNYDYNDYYYTSRIRRFYHPGATFGYHNPYYYQGYRHRPGWNVNISYGNPYYGYDPFYSPYSCYDPFWGPTWSNYYHAPYFYPYYYSPYYSPYSYNKGYYDGYYSNWNNSGGSGSGGSGGGMSTYYGSRNMQGSHNILNTGMRNAPTRIRKETEPETNDYKPLEIKNDQLRKDQPRGVVNEPVLQPGTEAIEAPKLDQQREVVKDEPKFEPGKESIEEPKNNTPETREIVPEENQQNPNTEWKSRYNTPLNERPKFNAPENSNDNNARPQEEEPQIRYEQPKEQPRFEQRNEQPRYESKPQPRYEQPKYQPRNEQPRYESKPQPQYEQPKIDRPSNNTQPRLNNNNNAPRNNSGSNSVPGNNNNSGGSKPRFQGR